MCLYTGKLVREQQNQSLKNGIVINIVFNTKNIAIYLRK